MTDVRAIVATPPWAARPVLIVPQLLSNYDGGTACKAVMPHVYHLLGRNLVDVSSRYPAFFAQQRETWLTQYERPEDRASACTAMELDKLARMSGAAPRAGYERALAWMTSGEPALRLKAVFTFRDLADEPSRKALERLAHDHDAQVASFARNALDEK